jgi:hypothetical protein
MNKKIILTESERKTIIANKEKAIIESFAKTFNKIKRIDENEIKENNYEDWELEDRKQQHGIHPEIDPSELYDDEISENEGSLSPEEQKILNDILNESDMLNEGMFDSVIEKVKSYAQKGMMTVGILSALLGTPNLSMAQQSQIKQAAKTEMTIQKSPFASKEWSALKSLCQKTNGKVLSFNDYDGPQETLNWGSHKTKGAKTGIGLSVEKDGSYSLDATGDIQQIVQMLNKAGLGQFKTDNYGHKTMEMYKIPANQYNTLLSALQTVTPLLK